MRVWSTAHLKPLALAGILAAGLTAATGCGGGGSGGGGGASGFLVVGFQPDGNPDAVFRNEPLVLEFSGAVDRRSVSEAGLAVRQGEDLIPGRIEIEGRRILWYRTVLPEDRNDYFPDNHPPINGIGFRGGARFTIVLVGGSPYSVRSRSGTPLTRTFQANFRTRVDFLPEDPPVPPTYVGPVTFDSPHLEEGDPFSEIPEDWPLVDPSNVEIAVPFSEAMHPDLLDPFETVVTTNVTPGDPAPPGAGTTLLMEPLPSPDGRSIVIRNLVSLGDNPQSAAPSEFEVRLSPSLADLAGNPVGDEIVFHFRTIDKPGEPNFTVVTETFDTQAREDASATSALWGNGVLEGTNVNARSHDFTPQDTNFNLAHPLVEQGNPATPLGCRFQMKFEPADVNVQPGEQIVGMSWSPKSGYVFASSYREVTIKIGHFLKQTGEALDRFYDNNWQLVSGNPVTVFRGDYVFDNALNVAWVPWPAFTADFEYDGTRPLVFEYNMPEGGDTFQLFRNRSTGPSPRNRQFSNGGEPASATGPENTKYHHRFFFVSKKSIGQSIPISAGVGADYGGFLVLADPNRAGTEITTEWGGSPGGAPPPQFSQNIHDADGFSHIVFRITLVADALTGIVPRVYSVSFAYALPEG